MRDIVVLITGEGAPGTPGIIKSLNYFCKKFVEGLAIIRGIQVND